MLIVDRTSVIVILVVGGIVASPIAAGAFELSGAWATSANLCNKVFDRKDGRVTFSELSDLYGSGFIIENSQIRGKIAKCTITSKKEDGSNIALTASCATSIMVQPLQFGLKVISNDSISRSFPDIPGMSISYERCKF
jgi:hypothetical protein